MDKEILENVKWDKDFSIHGIIRVDSPEKIIKDAPKNVREQK